MKSFKNLIALFLCGALAVSVAGCSTDRNVETERNGREAEESTEEETIGEETEISESEESEETEESEAASGEETSGEESEAPEESEDTEATEAPSAESTLWLIDVTDEDQIHALINAMEAGYPQIGDTMPDAMGRLNEAAGYSPISWTLSNIPHIQFTYARVYADGRDFEDVNGRDIVEYIGYDGFVINDDDINNPFIEGYDTEAYNPKLWASAVLHVYSAEDASEAFGIISSYLDGLYGGESSDEMPPNGQIHHSRGEDGRTATITMYTDEDLVDELGYIKIVIDLNAPLPEA